MSENRPNTTRRDFLKCLGAGAALAAAPTVVRAADPVKKRPTNFIIIFADDQGYQDLGCFGSPKIKTPRLDRMAKEGCRFTDFYSAAPVCTPSRAALLTGCYAQRVSLPGVLFPRNVIGLSPKEITIADMLKAKGYATMCIGKWHLGHLKPFLPTAHGFDGYFGIPYSNDMTVDPKMDVAGDVNFREGMTLEKMRTGKPLRHKVPLFRDDKVAEYPCDQATLTQRYTAEALKFITANKDKPFFLYLPHTFPHVPLFASPPFAGKSERGLYGDVIETIDWSTGQILDALKKLGLEENTLVVYTSDNGPWLSKGKDGGCALPLRGGKFQTWDGGMREPTVMRWPGVIPPGTECDQLASTIDLLPTIAALSGARVPKDRVIDGMDISALLKDPKGKSPRETFFFYRGMSLEAVRCGTWKLRLNKAGGGRRKKGQPAPKPTKAKYPGQLYDLRADIGETKDVADQHPEIVAKLAKLIQDFDAELKAHKRDCGKVEIPKTK